MATRRSRLLQLQVAVLLLVGLSVASAALPKHPFFGPVQAGAMDSRYDDYDTTKLCLQNQHTCFSNGYYDFAIQLGCCSKERHYSHDDSMLDLASLAAGWCVFTQHPLFSYGPGIDVPGTGTEILSTFEATCFLHSGSDECSLGACEDSVMHVTGVVTGEFFSVYDSNYVPVVGCNYGSHRGDGSRSGNGTSISMQDWVEKMMELLNIPAAPEKASAELVQPPEPSYLYEAYFSTLFHGVATTYTSSGKLIGTGPFEYAIPFVYSPYMYRSISPGEVGARRVYTPQAIKASVHSLPKGHY